MKKLELIAKRISEISDEIKQLKSEREANLQHCNASDDDEFGSQREWICKEWNERENCLYVAYRWIKEDRDDVSDAYPAEYADYYECLFHNGCKNCISAYEAKKKIGALKQERGRLVGNITKIGHTL